MTDSLPKLRRLLNEAHARIRELESLPKPDPVVEIREVRVNVPGPERVVNKLVPFEVYFPIEKEVEVEKPVIQIKEVEKLVPFNVEKTVWRDIEVPVPFYVDRIVYNDVIKEVEVHVPQYPPSVQRIETERVVYQDNPDHIETIRRLQEQLCQFTFQSDM